MNLKENKERIYQQVAEATQQAERSLGSVQVIAVTKYVDSDVARQLVETGVTHIGENRVDKFLDKYQSLQDCDLTWHLIGSLQRRKVKDVINYVDYFHALDSLKLATEIQKRAEHPIKCFLQVNISGEVSKHGFNTDEIEDVLEELATLDKIELVGLMTMAPFEASEEQLECIFQETEILREKLASKNKANMPFTELSMGMSGDYTSAIKHGSTFVRIGTAFFS